LKKKNQPDFTWIKKNINWVSITLIILIGLLTYSSSFDCAFQFDDSRVIVKNSEIRTLSNYFTISKWININLRPLSSLTFAINYSIHKLQLFGYHFVNLFIHVVAGLTIFYLVQLLLSLSLFSKSILSRDKRAVALLVSLIFIAHPIQTMAVTYIVQRMTSLAGMFYLLSVYWYARGRFLHVEQGYDFSVLRNYIFALLFGVCASLSKQNAITFPAAMLLLELFFVCDEEGEPYIKYLLISSSSLAIIFLVFVISGNLPRETATISRTDYLITQFIVIVKYIKLLILPINQNADYAHKIARSFFEAKVFGSFLFITGLLATGIWLFKRKRILSFCIFWFFLTLSVESSIIPIRDVMFEHRLYLPTFGFSFFLVTFLYEQFAEKNKLFITIFLSILIFLFGIGTFRRNLVWKTKQTLWEDITKKSKTNPRSYNNLAETYFKMGDFVKAEEYFHKALAAKPGHASAWNNLGAIRYKEGNYEKAIIHFKKAVELRPAYADALHNIGRIYYHQGDLDSAYDYFKKSLTIKPDYPDGLNSMSMLLYKRGNIDESIVYLERLLLLKATDVKLITNMGLMYMAKKSYTKAIVYFKQALDIKPEDMKARRNLAIARRKLNMR